MYCTNCGKENLDSVNFCGYCGHKKEIQVFCPSCKTLIGNDMAFCTNCGLKVREDKPHMSSSALEELEFYDEEDVDLREELEPGSFDYEERDLARRLEELELSIEDLRLEEFESDELEELEEIDEFELEELADLDVEDLERSDFEILDLDKLEHIKYQVADSIPEEKEKPVLEEEGDFVDLGIYGTQDEPTTTTAVDGNGIVESEVYFDDEDDLGIEDFEIDFEKI